MKLHDGVFVATNKVKSNTMETAIKLSSRGQHDFQLVQRALNNHDQQAYSELLSIYQKSLYYIMLKMTGNPADADDLTIEAFSKAFQNLENYSPDFAFSTWLFRIATNNAIDYMRKKARIDTAVQFGEEGENKVLLNMPTPNPGPEDLLINDQKVDLMHKVVQRLKPQYRRLIELRYFKEFSYNEIVDEMEMPLGTVKTQIFRARELMFHMLRTHKEII